MITSHTEMSVSLDNIGKKYPIIRSNAFSGSDFWALKGLSLNIPKGLIYGVIGRNGAGKTTLLNIIAKTLNPTEGDILTSGRVCGLFNLGVGFQDELTGRENIFLNGAILGAAKKELESKLDPIIEFSELGKFIDMPLGSFSQGMRLRLGFSIIANMDFDILVIDEVLAVGDSLFQSKCYERLMDFKRQGKTLVITSQDTAMIERLCDEAVLLDHGRMLSKGNSREVIDRYSALLNTEKFFVGPENKKAILVENTKKWADDVSNWGKRLGTKEVAIDSVKFINRFGFKRSSIKTRGPLKIKVHFTAKNKVKDPHFGIAIFRKDGVYCYGPNTGFDGQVIPELKPGKGWFMLEYKNLLLAPGEYMVSVAIWDKDEKIAFDYHDGSYKLIINGHENKDNELLNIPFKLKNAKHSSRKDLFMTNTPVRFDISFPCNKNIPGGSYAWIGIYRDDGIYCQGVFSPFENKPIDIFFPKLALLPGKYYISSGICDSSKKKFIIRTDNVYNFRMVFDKQDHGTVYLKHEWKLRAIKVKV